MAGVILTAALWPLMWAQAGELVEGEGFDYDDYAVALTKHVDENGMVDYKTMKEEVGPLHGFLDEIDELEPKAYEEWNDNEKIAFWINAYNACTLEAIVVHYPIKPSFPARLWYPKNSLRQISGVWDSLEFRVMDKRMTLNEIEHGELRKKFDEPRIHMALVCAAMSCPLLRNEPYTGAKLDEQLDDQSRRFLADTDNFRIDREQNVVFFSSILRWFAKDFVKKYGTDEKFKGRNRKKRAVLNFISGYVDEEDRRYLAEKKYNIKYIDYDWALNEQKDK